MAIHRLAAEAQRKARGWAQGKTRTCRCALRFGWVLFRRHPRRAWAPSVCSRWVC